MRPPPNLTVTVYASTGRSPELESSRGDYLAIVVCYLARVWIVLTRFDSRCDIKQ